MAKLVAKYRARQAKGVIKTNTLERVIFSNTFGSNKMLQDAYKEAETLPTGLEFMSDTWASLYKHEFETEEELPPHMDINRRLMSQLHKLDDFVGMRKRSVQDKVMSAVGASALAPIVMASIPQDAQDHIEESKQQNQMSEDLKRQAEHLQQMAEQAAKNGDQNADKLQKQADSAQYQSQVAQMKAENAAQQAKTSIDNPMVLHQMAQALKQGADKAKEMQEALGTFAGKEGGEPSVRSVDEALKIAEMIRGNPVLKRIAQLAGRMLAFSRGIRKKRMQYIPPELVGVEYGNAIERVHPSELLLLSEPEMEDLFMINFLEGKLLQYKNYGPKEVGKGPIVVCLDSSGSMNGERDEWARAVALTLWKTAYKDNRDFSVVVFAGPGHERTFEIKDIPSALEMLSFKYGGGTSFETALKGAMNVLEQGKDKGDIVFITDGEDHLSDKFKNEFLDLKNGKNFSVFSILIGHWGEGENVRDWSDKVVKLEVNDDNNTLDELFRFI